MLCISCLVLSHSRYSLVKLKQIQRRALQIIDPYQSYDENLAVLSFPPIRLMLDVTSREYYNKILYSNDHPLHHIIQPNQCTRSLRVRRMSYTPVCRTAKYANSLFIKYAHCFYHFYFFNLNTIMCHHQFFIFFMKLL